MLNFSENDKTFQEAISKTNSIPKLYELRIKLDESIHTISESKYNAGKDIIESRINELLDKIVIEKNDDIITFSNLALNEGTVYEDTKDQISLGCFNDDNRNYSKESAYFKCYNSTDYTKATKLARITLLDPTYITSHRNPKHIENWSMSNGEMRLLDTLMHKNLRGESVWFWLCYEFNRETGNQYEFGTKIPNFTNIKGGK